MPRPTGDSENPNQEWTSIDEACGIVRSTNTMPLPAVPQSCSLVTALRTMESMTATIVLWFSVVEA